MLCRKPYVKDGLAFGCGQCLTCRINKRREWTHRIMLEAAQYGDNSFITLTYDDEHLPEGHNVVPRDLQLFIKRLRKYHGQRKLRYFAVGEYGDETNRPHYHLAVFNLPSCRRGITAVDRAGYCCDQCESVKRIWDRGNVFLGTVNRDSIQYICGYVTKKMTGEKDERLGGRHPEFARMSLRPGIGGDFIPDVASSLMDFNLEKRLTDVPKILAHGKSQYPLGRYLVGRLRQHIGRDAKSPQATLEEAKKKLLPLRQSAFVNSRSFAKEIVQAHEGKRLQKELKYRKRGML